MLVSRTWKHFAHQIEYLWWMWYCNRTWWQIDFLYLFGSENTSRFTRNSRDFRIRICYGQNPCDLRLCLDIWFFDYPPSCNWKKNGKKTRKRKSTSVNATGQLSRSKIRFRSLNSTLYTRRVKRTLGSGSTV